MAKRAKRQDVADDASQNRPTKRAKSSRDETPPAIVNGKPYKSPIVLIPRLHQDGSQPKRQEQSSSREIMTSDGPMSSQNFEGKLDQQTPGNGDDATQNKIVAEQRNTLEHSSPQQFHTSMYVGDHGSTATGLSPGVQEETLANKAIREPQQTHKIDAGSLRNPLKHKNDSHASTLSSTVAKAKSPTKEAGVGKSENTKRTVPENNNDFPNTLSPTEALRKREKRARKEARKAEKISGEKNQEVAREEDKSLSTHQPPTAEANPAKEKNERKAAKRAARKARKDKSMVRLKDPVHSAKNTSGKSEDPTKNVSVKIRESAAISVQSIENAWPLSAPSAGRFLDYDPIFVQDENGKECLIAANSCEVQLLSLKDSLPIRSYTTSTDRTVACISLSPIIYNAVDIVYDDGQQIQWLWTTGEATQGTSPARDKLVYLTCCMGVNGQPTPLYITRKGSASSVFLGQQLIHTTKALLNTVQAVGGGTSVVAIGRNTILLGMKTRGDSGADYVWSETSVQVPLTCGDARLVGSAITEKSKRSQISNLSLAVGNAQGQIHLYTDLSRVFGPSPQARLPAPQILHWHRETVSAVKFSKDGNYLISGGKETVLVIWQLDTGHKQFLPHLTAEIERIVVSPDGTRYAVQLGDNSIMVLSTSELKPVANFAGIQLPLTKNGRGAVYEAAMSDAAIIQDTGNASHILISVPPTQPKLLGDNSARPFLQTFDVRNSRHVSRQALTRNGVTDFTVGPEGNKIAPPDVSLMAMSEDAQWLATIDEWIPPASDLEHIAPRTKNLTATEINALREEQNRRREVYLKFWQWDAGENSWALSTRVDLPHARVLDADMGLGAGRVFALKASPTSCTFATIGEDGCVKIWRPKTRMHHGEALKGENGVKLKKWAASAVLTLPLSPGAFDGRIDSPFDVTDDLPEQSGVKRSMIVDASLSFSEDGSFLACAPSSEDDERPLVHLINTLSGKLVKSSHSFATPEQDVEHLAFLDRYLVTVSTQAFRVWDLIDDRPHFTCGLANGGDEAEPPLFAVNHTDGTMAFIAKSRPSKRGFRMQIFTPKKPEAVSETNLGNIAPVAILSKRKGTKGFTIVFEDGRIQTTTLPMHSNALSAETTKDASAGADEDHVAAQVEVALEETEDVDMQDAPALMDGASFAAPMLEQNAKERVVRPEQLAALFDEAPSFALPSVKDWFRTAVGLYAAQPNDNASVQ